MKKGIDGKIIIVIGLIVFVVSIVMIKKYNAHLQLFVIVGILMFFYGLYKVVLLKEEKIEKDIVKEEKQFEKHQRFNTSRDNFIKQNLNSRKTNKQKIEIILCPYCGYKVYSSFNYCPYCGHRLR